MRYAPGILSATSLSIRNAALGLTVPSGLTTSVIECFGPVYKGYVPSGITRVCFDGAIYLTRAHVFVNGLYLIALLTQSSNENTE